MATEKKDRTSPSDLGIDVGKGTDAPAFRWLVACLLFGAPINQELAARAYGELDDLGVLTPAKLAEARWQDVAEALGRGGYRRYDESKARELVELGAQVRDEYGGHLTRIRKDVSGRKELKERFEQFKGIGPTAADIFVREFASVWDL